MMRNSSSISAMFSAAVGSSMMSTSELKERALAISTICCLATARSMTFVRGSRSRWSLSNSSLRHVVHPFLIEEKREALARLAADEDVLRGGEVRHEIQFLVDDADAQVLGRAGVGDVDFLPLVEDPAGIPLVHARQDLHQGGFARPVLPHQGVHLAGAQIVTAIAQGVDAGERLFHSFHDDERVCHLASHHVNSSFGVSGEPVCAFVADMLPPAGEPVKVASGPCVAVCLPGIDVVRCLPSGWHDYCC